MRLKGLAIGLGIGCSALLGLHIARPYLRGQGAQVQLANVTVTLPLQNEGGHLYLQGRINQGGKSWFLLDSGAGDMFISEAQSRNLKPWRSLLPLQRSVPSVQDVQFQLGGLTLRDRRTYVLPDQQLEPVINFLGVPIAGILGYELFRDAVVEIDYAQSQLRLIQPQDFTVPPNSQRLPLAFKDNLPFVAVTIQPYNHPPLSGNLLVDLGSNGGLAIAAGCDLDQVLINAAPKILERDRLDIAGTHPVHLGQVQTLKLGDLELQQPLTIFTSGPSCTTVTGKLGNQIWQHYRLTFHYAQRSLFLRPRAAAPPYRYDLSGLRISASTNGSSPYIVRQVYADTPAAQHFQIGDRLLQINQTEVKARSLPQIRQILSEPNTEVILTVQRGSQVLMQKLFLKPLL